MSSGSVSIKDRHPPPATKGREVKTWPHEQKTRLFIPVQCNIMLPMTAQQGFLHNYIGQDLIKGTLRV